MEDKEIVLRRAKNAVISRDFNLAIRLYKSLLQDDVKNQFFYSDLIPFRSSQYTFSWHNISKIQVVFIPCYHLNHKLPLFLCDYIELGFNR